MQYIDVITNAVVTGKKVSREGDGWGAYVWSPVITTDNIEGSVQYVRLKRYVYKFREDARRADVMDEVGENGRIR